MPPNSTHTAGNDNPLVTALDKMIADLAKHDRKAYGDLGADPRPADTFTTFKALAVWGKRAGESVDNVGRRLVLGLELDSGHP